MTALDQALRRLDPARVVDWTASAIDHYSPSFAEGPVTAVLAELMQGAGLHVERQRVPAHPRAESPRENLIVRLGPEPLGLLWLGHMDTVPQRHGEPWRARRDGDLLYGLGAADMKGGCVAAAAALAAVAPLAEGFTRGIAVAFVVGEEEYGDGSEMLAEILDAPLVVVGEPTGLRACRRHHGHLECELTARGQRAHAALPELGASAIHAMMRWLTRILEHAPVGEGEDTQWFNLREIQGGGSLFAVAERCRAEVDVHFPSEGGVSEAMRVIEDAQLQTLLDHPACELLIRQTFVSLGYNLPAQTPAVLPLLRALDDVGLPHDNAAFRSHSDASLWFQRGSAPVVCGPGRLEVAHTAHEHVDVHELFKAAQLYTALFTRVGLSND